MTDEHYLGFVYLWENTHPDSLIYKKYIGQHIGSVDDGYIGSGTIFKKVFYAKKYRGFWKRTVLKKCLTVDELNQSEIELIEQYDAVNSKIFCNLREGGVNGKMHISSRKKMSVARRGKTPWNKGIKTGLPPWNKGFKLGSSWNKGLNTGKQPIDQIQKRIKSREEGFQKIVDDDTQTIINYINQYGSIKRCDIPTILQRECSGSVANHRLNILIKIGKVKPCVFGFRDKRYVLSTFNLPNIILQYINTCKEPPERGDILLYMFNQHGIQQGATDQLLKKMIRSKNIFQKRGYRKNLYYHNK